MKKLVFCAAFVAAMCMAGTTTAQAQDVKRKKSRKSNVTKKTAKHTVKRKKKHVARKKQIRKQLTDVNTKLIARLKPDAKTANVPKTKEAKNNKRFRHFI